MLTDEQILAEARFHFDVDAVGWAQVIIFARAMLSASKPAATSDAHPAGLDLARAMWAIRTQKRYTELEHAEIADLRILLREAFDDGFMAASPAAPAQSAEPVCTPHLDALLQWAYDQNYHAHATCLSEVRTIRKSSVLTNVALAANLLLDQLDAHLEAESDSGILYMQVEHCAEYRKRFDELTDALAALNPPRAKTGEAKYDPRDPGNWRDGDDACGNESASFPDLIDASEAAWKAHVESNDN